MTLLVSNALPGGEASPSLTGGEKLAIFISHSSQDVVVVQALVQLLQAALCIRASEILCSSVEGCRLKAGVSIEDALRDAVNSATVLIWLITPSSVDSRYAPLEVGARWGNKKRIVPLVRRKKDMALTEGGPLAGLNALDLSQSAQLLQLIDDVAHDLGVTPESAAAYDGHVKAVLATLKASRRKRRRARAKRRHR